MRHLVIKISDWVWRCCKVAWQVFLAIGAIAGLNADGPGFLDRLRQIGFNQALLLFVGRAWEMIAAEPVAVLTAVVSLSILWRMSADRAKVEQVREIERKRAAAKARAAKRPRKGKEQR